MNISILGTGYMGRTLGAGLLNAGHAITFGSREPDRATDLPAPVLSHAAAIARAASSSAHWRLPTPCIRCRRWPIRWRTGC